MVLDMNPIVHISVAKKEMIGDPLHFEYGYSYFVIRFPALYRMYVVLVKNIVI